MRIAALSDIHSNVYALDAVLSDVKKRGVDTSVNLGDILYGPIAPRATYDLLMENNLVTIRGNQDRQIYEATEREIDTNPTMAFIINELGREPLEWMSNLHFIYQLSDAVFLCHGTPNDDSVYLLEDIEDGYAKIRTNDDIIQLLNGQQSDVVLCGHTHTPRAVCINTNQLIVNPGSVGLPAYTDNEPVIHSMENYSPHASYAILEDKNGCWNIQHIKVAYDFEKAASDASKRGRNDWAHFLKTGRGL